MGFSFQPPFFMLSSSDIRKFTAFGVVPTMSLPYFGYGFDMSFVEANMVLYTVNLRFMLGASFIQLRMSYG